MSFEEKISCVQRIAIIDKDFEILKKDIDLFFLDKNPKPSITKLLALIIKNYISEANCSFVKVSEDTTKFVNDELKITIKIEDENVSPRIKDQKPERQYTPNTQAAVKPIENSISLRIGDSSFPCFFDEIC